MLKIQFQQVNEYVECADINTVPVPLKKPIWHEFTDLSITRNFAIKLFSNKPKVVIIQENTVISNCKDIRNKYHKDPRKMKVLSLEKLTPSDRPLSEVGFIYG